MKNLKYFLLIICFWSVTTFFSQTKISDTNKYKQIGLVWGFLKYHHPEISKGKYNWDNEFIRIIDKSIKIDSQEELNNLLSAFVAEYKTTYNPKRNLYNKKMLFRKNLDYDWIDIAVFGENLTNELLEIKNNGDISSYYAPFNKLTKQINFKNKISFKNFNYKIYSHKLLLLYDFWNMVEYYNVNKYLIDKNWGDYLEPFTEEFLNCKSEFEFEKIKMKLISKLQDSHSFYISKVVSDSLYKYKPYFYVKSINDSLLISTIYNKKLAEKDNIELGDVIFKIENKSISSNMDLFISNSISTSNINYLRKWSHFLFFKPNDSIYVDILKKDGKKMSRYIHLYNEYKTENTQTLLTNNKEYWSFIKEDIGYINLANINFKELKNAFSKFTSTKGLIIDLRNYPKNITNTDIANFIYPEKKEFIKILTPIKNSPSLNEYGTKSFLNFIINPFKVGRKNKNYYKGTIILLVNNLTQSNAEFIGMTIQQVPKCITIGQQTAGSVMNIVPYMMSDGTVINFTGRGAFYPNGDEVQGEGLKIDYYVKESAKNHDTDLYFKEAIKIIEKQKIIN